MTARLRTALLAIVVLVAAALALALQLGGDGSTTYEYLIPAGTGVRIDAGEPVAIVPSRLVVDVGDEISITNQDDRAHRVGPYFVQAGERLVHEFDEVGTIEDVCTVHPSGRLVIEVR